MCESQRLIKKSVQLFLILFLISTPIVWLALQFTNYQGDLTRIGKWSESLFRSQSAQPTIPKQLLISNSINEADILVIGDSFSENLQWQSVYQEQGIKVTTLLWSDIHYICENFTHQIEKAGFRGKKIIIESVERVAVRQIDKSIRCIHAPEIKGNAYTKEPLDSNFKATDTINLNGQFIAGIQTILNSWAIKHIPSYERFHNHNSKSTNIYAIHDGCAFFSNELCNYGLFFYEDYQQPPLGKTTIDQIKLLNQRIDPTGYRYEITWAVVPNKSSIYHRPLPEEFWKLLEKDRLGPNLYTYLKHQKYKIVDLYQPSDTHFSNAGYLLLGRHLLSK